MFTNKNNYYLYIDNTKLLNLNLIKLRGKFTIIYRNIKKIEPYTSLMRFRKKCKEKNIDFYVANNLNLANNLGADGIYLSSYNKGFKQLNYNRFKGKILGSAHNYKEIFEKKRQGCKKVFLSRFLKTDYVNVNKTSFLGLLKYNLITYLVNIPLIPLGGIRTNNINLVNLVNTDRFAIYSEVKKKPAIIRRLF